MASLLVNSRTTRLYSLARSQSRILPRLAANNNLINNRSFYAVARKYIEAFNRYGVKGTVWRLYNMGDVKFGYCVGTDRLGNKYYEDPTEVAGQQRYCEYHIDSFDNFDGDQIPPEWHAWLHYTTDAKPGDEAFKAENWAKVPISQKTDTPFEHHVGPTDCFVPHATLKRTRGYNSEHFMLKAGEPDQYYMQPNHPLRCRKRSNQIFEHVDYNEPKKSFENASGPLRDASLN